MAQIINTPSRSAYAGQAAGSALGKALEGLAGTFVGEFTRGKQRTMFEQQYPEHADILSQFHANPEVQQKLIANIDKNRFVQQQQQQQQMAALQERESIAQYFMDQGYSPEQAYSIASQPKDIRSAELKQLTKEPTWKELFARNELGVGGNRPGPGGSMSRLAQQLTPQEADQLREQGYDIPLPEGDTSIGQRLSSLGTGYALGSLGLPGDILSLPQTGINALSGYLGYDNVLPEYKSALSTAQGPDKKSLEETAARMGVAVDDPRFLQMLASGELAGIGQGIGEANILPPTSSELKKGVEKATKGTLPGKYLTPQTETQKWYEDVGQIVSYLTNPGKSFAKGGGKEVLKDLARGLGYAKAGKTLKWMGKEITGSELFGSALENGLYLFANLQPGSLRDVSQKEYGKFENQVIQKAAEQGKAIDMRPYDKEIRAITQKINAYAPQSDAYKYLAGEIVPLQNIMNRPYQDPKALWDLMKEVNTNASTAPAQAQRVMRDIKGLLENVLNDFSDKITPGAFKHLKNADRLWAKNAQASEFYNNMKSTVPLNTGIGMSLLFTGLYRKLVAGLAGVSGLNYAKQVVTDPTMQKYIGEMARASALNNSGLIKKASEKLNKRAEQINPRMARELMKQMQNQ